MNKWSIYDLIFPILEYFCIHFIVLLDLNVAPDILHPSNNLFTKYDLTIFPLDSVSTEFWVNI